MSQRSMPQLSMSQLSTSQLIKPQRLTNQRLYLAVGVLLSTMFLVPSAQAASCKIPKSYYKNVSCTSSRGHFLAIKDFGAPVAIIDSKGKRVVDLSRYQQVDANKISEGLLPVLRNGRVGYLNMQGREVVPTMYDMIKEGQSWARPVSEGRIVVKRNGNYGVVNTGNQTIVSFSSTISGIDDYKGGVARVRKNKAVSWLDKSGNPTTDPNSKNDHDGILQAPNNESMILARPALFTTLQPHQQDGRWGFVDENNVTMITYSFDEVRPFSEGMAGVRVDSKWGFVNLGGELVVPFRFENSGVQAEDNYNGAASFVFTDGKAWVGNLQNGRKLCINKEGTNVSCD